jgi:hypothetical protein
MLIAISFITKFHRIGTESMSFLCLDKEVGQAADESRICKKESKELNRGWK